MTSIDSFHAAKLIKIDNKEYFFYDLNVLGKKFNFNIDKLPYTLKIILENLLRNEDGIVVNKELIVNFFKEVSKKNNDNDTEISFYPTRVLMQDFTGVPAIADLAAMRDSIKQMNYNPNKINPISRVDLIIDHSVMVDSFGNANSYLQNVEKEFQRNRERYEFLKWGQSAFNNFFLVPPGAGICHQVNLENIAKTVWSKNIMGKNFIFPDSVVGTDSHTTMVNSLSVLGWGVGGIEAEAAMLGEPISMNIPKVIGFNIDGQLREGITATDLVLNVTEKLRKHGVVGKFVEFFGSGLKNLSLADRATISNMAPEYGATCGFFPTDKETINYLKLTGKDDHHINIVNTYSKIQKLFNNETEKNYDEVICFTLNDVEPTIAGPKRPQDKIFLKDVAKSFKDIGNDNNDNDTNKKNLNNGDIVIAAITSCTNTSNPHVMIAAGLLAKKAVEFKINVKSWVKTSLAPGSKVVSDYLDKSGLTKYLDKLGFNLVGYGCTTCIGNSGPLDEKISTEIKKNNLIVCSVLSGNRNFEGRIHQEIKANYLASPPLVVAYALAGNIKIDLTKDCIGTNDKGEKFYLKDLWPTSKEIENVIKNNLSKDMFIERYKEIYNGDNNWKKIKVKENDTFNWSSISTYIKSPPFFKKEKNKEIKDICDARALVMLGDSITTDHISPAGAIKPESPAGNYLLNRQISQFNFNSYGSRRGNHEIMTRGTFANHRIKNEILLDDKEGGITKCFVNNKEMSIYDASNYYKKQNIPLLIIAGTEYGTGSSRDWAAKGTKLLGVEVVIAESFERIHRSNLVGMGVLPLEFKDGQNRKSLKLNGSEKYTFKGLNNLSPKKIISCEINKDSSIITINLKCRIDTFKELEYFKSGGILQYVLEKIIKKAA